MERDKRNNQGRLTEKKISRAKQEDVDNKTTGKADEDRSIQAEELLREPSGAEAYAQNADMERMERVDRVEKKMPEPDGMNAAGEREGSVYLQRSAETDQEVPAGGGHT